MSVRTLRGVLLAAVLFVGWLAPIETWTPPPTIQVSALKPVDLAAANSELPLPDLERTLFDGPSRQIAVRASRSARRATQPVSRVSYSPKASGGVERWRSLVARYDWPVESVLRIIGCESHGDPNARNRHSSATGLLQILHGSLDPERNIEHGYQMWRARGFQPWAASRRCSGVR